MCRHRGKPAKAALGKRKSDVRINKCEKYETDINSVAPGSDERLGVVDSAFKNLME